MKYIFIILGDSYLERYAWKGTVLSEKLKEYRFHHDNIQPEMTEVLPKTGICNYIIMIWNVGNDLFGYYECDNVAEAVRIQSEIPIVAKWN